MNDPIETAAAAVKADAATLAGGARTWLRRNAGGLLGVAATALAVALLALRLG